VTDPTNTNEENGATDPSTVPFSADPAAEVAALKARAAELEDKNLRLQAEIENVRRRAQREMSDSLKYAALPLARDILPVLDNVNRGLQAAANQSGDAGTFIEGMKLVAQQMERVLTQHGVTKITAEGAPFDPNLHQAMLQQPHPEVPAMTVLQEYAPGYQLHDRVVRPSQVIVSAGPPQA
jgi:molecular chaperone GrpE